MRGLLYLSDGNNAKSTWILAGKGEGGKGKERKGITTLFTYTHFTLQESQQTKERV